MGCCCGKQKEKKDEAPEGIKSGDHTNLKRGALNINPKTTRFGNYIAEKSKQDPNYYIALWDHQARTASELNLKKGDRVMEVDTEDDAGSEWVFVTHENGTGYVQRNFLAKMNTLEVEPWFFPLASRGDSEQLLKGAPDGTFLIRIRKSEAEEKNPYCLSIQFENATRHYKVKEAQALGKTWYLIGEKRFDSLSALIAYYKSTKTEEMVCCLAKAANKQQPTRGVLSVEAQKHWREIDRKLLKVENEISRKQFGVVCKAVWKPPAGEPLVVLLKELRGVNATDRQMFLNEAVIMKNLVHDRIVPLYGVISTSEPYCIISEYMAGGCLRDFLRKCESEDNMLSVEARVNICTQVADGMAFMASRHIVHRNLMAENIFVRGPPPPANMQTAGGGKVEVKIGGFGFSQWAPAGPTTGQEVRDTLSIKWMAPEVIAQASYSTASDVWSFGVVVHEIFTHGQEPYPGMTARGVRKYVVDESKYMERHGRVPEKVYRQMEACFVFNWEARPTFHSLFCFFDSFYTKEHGYRKALPR